MHSMRQVLVTLTCLLMVSSAAFGQEASIAGVVKDNSGAVLPGVTVEAASPALIEKVRSVISDGTGQYRIINLRPGTYTVTFTLTGFSAVKREGIELTGAFTATVNGELSVGSVAETVTVTGASPIVDVQGVAQQKVLTKEVIDAIPTSRTHFSIATTIPAMQTSNQGDVGGTNAISLVFLTSHGGRVTDQRITIEGLSTNNAEGASQYSGYLPNISSTEEMTVDYAGGGAEMGTGGVRLNIVPREGGNTFRATMFAGGLGGNFMQGNNYDADLQARGLPRQNSIQKLWDVNPGGGGPILKDKVWWYAAARWNGDDIYAGGFANKNAGNPNAWTYVPDPSKPSINRSQQRSLNARLTWQINSRNKLGFFYDDQMRDQLNFMTPLISPEVGFGLRYPYTNLTTVTWTSPMTNRLLFEAGASYHPEEWRTTDPDDPAAYPITNMIGVTDIGTGMQYRAWNGFELADTTTNVTNVRAAMSYVTGTHAFKVGFANQHATRAWHAQVTGSNLAYVFNNGTPILLIESSDPRDIKENIGMDLGVFVQDKWTTGRITANLGARYDHFDSYFPPQELGPTTFIPTRNFSFPKLDWVNWNDITPRLGIAYDLAGDGRTALKATLNKYVLAFGLQGTFGDGSNPVNNVPGSASRAWNDNTFPVGDPRRGNFVPDCNLLNPLADDECGPLLNQNFGLNVPSATIDPAIRRGWNSRGYDWEFSTGVQHQLTPRIAVDVEYFRRWYGNFIAIDNQSTTATDYTPFTITAPTSSQLPGGGGYPVSGLFDLNPDKVGQISNLYTLASNYGNEIEHWNGIDIGANTRLGPGIILQGGLSTGRTVTDDCDIVAKSPEILSGLVATNATAQVVLPTTPQTTYCHQNSGFLTQVKGFGSYTIPKADIQVSVNFQSYVAPGSNSNGGATASSLVAFVGPAIQANYVVPTAVAAQTLGRPLSGDAATATVGILAPGAIYGDRVNQTDMKVSKILRFGRTRTSVSLEVFNLFNRNTVLAENAAFNSFRAPLSILQARFAKIGVQFDF